MEDKTLVRRHYPTALLIRVGRRMLQIQTLQKNLSSPQSTPIDAWHDAAQRIRNNVYDGLDERSS